MVAEPFQHQTQPCQDLAAEQLLKKSSTPRNRPCRVHSFIHCLSAEHCYWVWSFEPAKKLSEKAPGRTLEVELKRMSSSSAQAQSCPCIHLLKRSHTPTFTCLPSPLQQCMAPWPTILNLNWKKDCNINRTFTTCIGNLFCCVIIYKVLLPPFCTGKYA